MNTYRRSGWFLWIMIIAVGLAACAAPQDASRSRSEYVAEYGATVAAQGYVSESELLKGIMPAEEIRVEEYLNYYEQNFPQPSSEYALGINATLGNTFVPDEGGEVWLQIGLQAGESTEQDLRPLNVALVLDKSGSMADADKMTYLKQSLYIFLDELDSEDIISIVVYDDQASVWLPAQSVGDGEAVRSAIDQLNPGGSTNLHGGLMLGFEQVEKYYSDQLNNRVILFTDGVANVGVTDPDQIAADALAFNQQGIFVSTIGLGLDFNDELLSTLAEQGKGNYHFISDAEEMERVFRQEAAGLVQTVATDVWLTVELATGTQLQRVYGYDYDLKGSTMKVQFDDAGAETNQILMVKMIVPASQGYDLSLANATLDYIDAFSEERVQEQVALSVSYGAPEPYDPFVSPSVRRNATILLMAETLQQVSFLCDQRDYQEALDLVQEIKADIWEIATQEGDEEMQEDVILLDNYETILQRLIEVSSGQSTTVTGQASDNQYSRAPQCPGSCLLSVGILAAMLLFIVYLLRFRWSQVE
jgi:Ca-activated chloride channel family protein